MIQPLLYLQGQIGGIEARIANGEFEIGGYVSLLLKSSKEKSQACSLGEAKNAVEGAMVFIAVEHVVHGRIKFGIASIFGLHPPCFPNLSTVYT